jgi:hypothetical protein
MNTQQQTIKSNAALYLLVGGLAEYKARSLLYLYNDSIYFDNVEICGLKGLHYKLQHTEKRKQKERINTYPNPTLDYSIIKFKDIFSGQMLLYDITGKLIWKSDEKEILEKVIMLKNLDAGIYFLSAQSSSGELFNVKIIKQ